MDLLVETAYPQLKPDVTPKELAEIYTPTAKELALADETAGKAPVNRLGFLMHLKLFARLGYFSRLNDAPEKIKLHIADVASVKRIPTKRQIEDYERSGTQRRHLKIIRDYMKVRSLDDTGRAWLESVAERAALTKNTIPDIINVMTEELVKEFYELPGFTVLKRIATTSREKVNSTYFDQITMSLSNEAKKIIDSLLKTSRELPQSGWHTLKREPKKPTNKEVRQYLQHVQRMSELVDQLPPILNIPYIKLRHFRNHAQSLDAAQMTRLTPSKRYALAVIYIRSQFSKTLDDTANMFVRLIRNIQTNAQQQLQAYQLQHQKRTDELIAQLRKILVAYHESENTEQQQKAMQQALPDDVETMINTCEEHLAYANNNYFPFMLKPYQSVRSLLINCLDILEPRSTNTDKLTERLIASLQLLRKSRLDVIDPEMLGLDGEKNFTWMSDTWRKLAVIKAGKNQINLHRKYYELAVLLHIKQELESADLFVQYSGHFDDYRERWASDEVYQKELPNYCEVSGIDSDPDIFCDKLKKWLSDVAKEVDDAFPEQSHAQIINGKLLLRKPEKSELTDAVKELDNILTQRLPVTNIIDVLTDMEKWLQLHKNFGPMSGNETRMDDPQLRFITTAFCYGCNLGPTQTSRSIKGVDLSRKQIAWFNLKNVNEDQLNKSLFKVVNLYNKLELPGYWGTGKHAAVDGTKWNLYEQNLLSEYHIRYGGYGGIGYYLVSDKYIALFNHFIPCGVYEANYLLDVLMDNKSDIQPEFIHGDTQAQNYPVFALAYLLGIQLMPRIRNINDLVLSKPDKRHSYKNINSLFNDSIDWKLIKTYLPDMLRAAVSIKLGLLSASTILRRLGTASRKNKLYYALRELGKVVRTVFLLRYISDVELRRTINSATNKNEEFNGFTKWVFFGGEGVIAENLMVEQHKIIKYNQLVSNMLILHNAVEMTKVIKQLQDEGHQITPEVLAGTAPYRTANINRFGDYQLDMERDTPSFDVNIKILQ